MVLGNILPPWNLIVCTFSFSESSSFGSGELILSRTTPEYSLRVSTALLEATLSWWLSSLVLWKQAVEVIKFQERKQTLAYFIYQY